MLFADVIPRGREGDPPSALLVSVWRAATHGGIAVVTFGFFELKCSCKAAGLARDVSSSAWFVDRKKRNCWGKGLAGMGGKENTAKPSPIYYAFIRFIFPNVKNNETDVSFQRKDRAREHAQGLDWRWKTIRHTHQLK